MSSRDVQRRLKELREKVRYHDYRYYVLNDPVISDQEYDDLYRSLVELEQKHPDMITEDSPTQRIGGEPLKTFATVTHHTKMLSLDNTYNEDEVGEFFDRVERALNRQPHYEVSLKVDGVAVSLVYRKGSLVRGATRGDGIHGDDITQNIRTIRSIPLHLNVKEALIDILEVRGEVFLSRKAFNRLNQDREKKGLSLFANPRNAAAGTLKLLDPKEVARRGLDIFIHTIPEQPTRRFSSDYELLHHLSGAGLKIIPNMALCKDQKEVFTEIERWKEKRKKLPYDVDGLVIKVDAFQQREQLGHTIKSPRWAIAYKYPGVQANTKVLDIKVQVGRTGRITPVAYLEPVHLSGSTVSRATLHNEDEIKRKDIRINDQVVVEKGGEIIPKIVTAIKERRTGKEKKYRFPRVCPVCKHKIVRLPEEADWRCMNTSCPAKIKGVILHFASRQAMDIEGLGEALVDALVDKKILTRIDGIYELNRDVLIKIDRMGERSADNLLASIEKSKNKPFSRVLFALGIPHVGMNASHVLSNRYTTIHDLMKATVEELSNIPGIGEIISKSIVNYFNNKSNKRLIENLQQHGLQFSVQEDSIQGRVLQGKTFVFTGELEKTTRSEAHEQVRKSGGYPASSLSKNTDYLVVGKNPGSKYTRAKKLGVKIISEKEFFDLITEG